MFMVKEELKYTKKLTMARLRSNKKGIVIFFVITAFLMLSSLIPSLIAIFKHSNIPTMEKFQDYSITYFIGMAIGFVVMTIQYREQNDALSLFPQTNTSRFLSAQLKGYLCLFGVTITVFLVYILQYITLKMASSLHDNVIFVLDIDFGFLLVGLLTMLLYAMQLFTFLTMIGVIVRKFGIYSVLVLMAILITLIINLTWTVHYIPKFISNMLFDSKITVFFIKNVLLFFTMNVFSVILNYYTIYYKTIRISRTLVATITLIGFIAAIVFSGTVGIVALNTSQISSPSEESATNHEVIPRMNKIEIDVSGLKKDSIIHIVTNDNIKDSSHSNYSMSINSESTLTITGNTLTIYYNYPLDAYNGINIMDFTNPSFTAKLDGNTLYLNFEYNKNVKLVLLPIWSMARNFDYYKDKNVAIDSFINSHASGSGFINLIFE